MHISLAKWNYKSIHRTNTFISLVVVLSICPSMYFLISYINDSRYLSTYINLVRVTVVVVKERENVPMRQKRVFGRRRTNSTNKERSGARLSTTDLLTTERCVEFVTPRDGAYGSTTIHIFILSVNMIPPNLSTRMKHSR